MIHESAIAALVAQHRPGFCAGCEQPEPAEACTELGADADDTRGGMQMLAWLLVTAFVSVCALVAVVA